MSEQLRLFEEIKHDRMTEEQIIASVKSFHQQERLKMIPETLKGMAALVVFQFVNMYMVWNRVSAAIPKRALCSYPFTWYKAAVLGSKSRTGTRLTKKITISNYVCLLFVLCHCDFCSPAWRFCTTRMSSDKEPVDLDEYELIRNNQEVEKIEVLGKVRLLLGGGGGGRGLAGEGHQ